ncbi:MAG: GMC family oxidoreductase [Polyangiaceae bacterium]|nr:GMC family oxidoreductase [Polyangiaceae bacterium]
MRRSTYDFDWVIIGSGFGGSVTALRLGERGSRVLVLEQGKRWAPADFPRTNWDLRRWLWQPELGLMGFFRMSFFEHVTVLHGAGVGGGSLVYANTLPRPPRAFYESGTWTGLADWERELAPHYETAERMLGATDNPREFVGDRALRAVARDLNSENRCHPTRVGVYFGTPEVTVADPYFGGRGPMRTGCSFCGSCMTGCRVGAKNTLDRNYLYLAERLGVTVRAETEVLAVRPLERGGYRVECRTTVGGATRTAVTTCRVVFAGGVLGTVPLLLRLREDPLGLPHLSRRVGHGVRTNHEALLGVVAPDATEPFSDGIAITSILEVDAHSHLEPVRYGAGSGFFRLLVMPTASGSHTGARLLGMLGELVTRPRAWWRVLAVRDFAKKTQILLFMRAIEDTLTLRLGRSARTGFARGLMTRASHAQSAPRGNLPEATALAKRFAAKVNGEVATLATEALLGTPTTAHLLGGAVIADSPERGVIDRDHRVFGYDGLFVIDGSAVPANPGVNPSLSIAALAERAARRIANG